MAFSAQKLEEIENYYPKLLRFFELLTRDTDVAQDLVQETYLRVYRISQKSYLEPEHVPGYMQRVGHRIFLNKLRDDKAPSRGRSLGYKFTDADDYERVIESPDGRNKDPVQGLRVQELLAAVDKLPSKMREDFERHYVQGYTGAEIVKMTGYHKGYISHRLKNLRLELAKQPF